MKKLNLFLFCVLITFFISCNSHKNETTKDRISADSLMLLPYSKVDTLPGFNDSLIHLPSSLDTCDPLHRQILIVNTFYVFNSNFQEDRSSPPDVQRSILLRGHHSPSSCKYLAQAYLHFVSDKKFLRPPSFSIITLNNGTKYAELRFYFLDYYFDSILFDIINSKDIYCWRGVFSNGLVYGDVETGRKIL